ncbi:hypothetical protein EJB05_42100, partial [Eragrostis curvula]
MSAAAEEYPWREQVIGDTMAAQRSSLVLASYPVLLLLVILAAFVRYLWIALAMYGALLLLLFCVSRTLSAQAQQQPDAAAGASRRGGSSLGGLSAAAIAAVAPAFPYDDGEAQCAVCIEAVKGGEAARRLPACAHTFHVGCIDMWLHSHATCPVCRCQLVPLPHKPAKEAPEPPVQPPLPEAPLPPV